MRLFLADVADGGDERSPPRAGDGLRPVPWLDPAQTSQGPTRRCGDGSLRIFPYLYGYPKMGYRMQYILIRDILLWDYPDLGLS